MISRLFSFAHWISLAVLALRQRDEEVRSRLQHSITTSAIERLREDLAKLESKVERLQPPEAQE